MNAKGSDFLLYSHRGASGYAPENTLAAFKLAMDMGAPRIELDVRLSSDAELVVIHDESVDRTTNGKGAVNDLSLAQLKALDAGAWFSDKFRGERIPTLDEALSLSSQGAKFCIEIKERRNEEAACRKVVDLLRKRRVICDTIVSSFSISALKTVRQLDKHIRLSMLLGRSGVSETAAATAREVGAASVSCHMQIITAAVVDGLHSAGLLAFAWGSTNDETGLKALLDTGIDGMTSNWPDVVLKLLAERGWQSA